jgi:hypothetical protein
MISRRLAVNANVEDVHRYEKKNFELPHANPNDCSPFKWYQLHGWRIVNAFRRRHLIVDRFVLLDLTTPFLQNHAAAKTLQHWYGMSSRIRIERNVPFLFSSS